MLTNQMIDFHNCCITFTKCHIIAIDLIYRHYIMARTSWEYTPFLLTWRVWPTRLIVGCQALGYRTESNLPFFSQSLSYIELMLVLLCCTNSADSGRKLTLLYVANDVIQNSKKKGPEYRTEFAKVLPRVFQGIGKWVKQTASIDYQKLAYTSCNGLLSRSQGAAIILVVNKYMYIGNVNFIMKSYTLSVVSLNLLEHWYFQRADLTWNE